MEFSKVKLGDVCVVGDGAHTMVKRTDSGVPYLTSKNIKTGFLDLSKIDYISYGDYENLFSASKGSVRNLSTGDILIGIIGTFGNTYLYKSVDKFGISSSIGIIRPNTEKVNSLFLYYQITSVRFKGFVEAFKGGSVQGYTNLPTIRKLPIVLPPLNTQKQIAKILSTLDSKIELNKDIIFNLEQLAQTLFKRWFVDFEFPDENGQPYKSSGGEMVESELGLMPSIYNVQFLSENVDFLSGGTPKTKIKEYWNGDIPFFTPKDITGSVYATQTEKSITDLGLSKCNSRLYPKESLFITARGTVGKLNIANNDMAMNQSCFALKHNEGYQHFLFFIMQTLLREIIQGSNGAVFNAINLRDLSTLKVIYPTKELITSFEEIVKPIFGMLSEKEEENINLKNIRDTLLPKLISGEIELLTEIEVL